MYWKQERDKHYFGGNRELAIQRDGKKCVKCGITREQHIKTFSRDITVDHIVGHGVHDSNSVEPNNSLENLQTLCLVCHGHKDGVRGSRSKNLTTNQVANILHLKGSITQRRLAGAYGITQPMVNHILTGRFVHNKLQPTK